MKQKLTLLLIALFTTMGAWAADITVSPSNGVYWKNGAQTSDAWAPIWKSNAKASDMTTPMLVLTGETGMNTANGDIYSNQTYTLEAPSGYTIVSYTFNGTATDGDVTIKLIPNSLSILSLIISICNNPKKPHLNPKPNALDVSGVNCKDASFNFNFSKASLNSGYLDVSIG